MRFGLLAALALCHGCVDQGPGPQPKKVEPAYVQAHLLGKLPDGVDRFDVKVGDFAIYLGNKVDRPRVAPGAPVTITHYWKVLKAVDARWRMFALVRGPANTPDFMNLLPTDMEIAHGPTTWQEGELVEDVQTFIVRPDWHSATATVTVGMIEVGKHGPLDRLPVTGPKTADNAIVAHVLDVDLSRAPPPKGTAHVPRANGPIVIDGVGTDAGWAGAAQADLITAENSADPVGKAVAKMTWDDTYLYIWVSIADTDIVSPFKKHDDPLWHADCVEIFIDADSNRKGYVELQVGPNNVTFDSWFATTRAQPGDEAWTSDMVTGVKLRGTTEPNDVDQGWDVEIGIPWAAVKGKDEAMAVRLPPQVGDRWRLNIVRVDHKSGDDPKKMTAASWNRISTSDFHALDRMLTVVFADSSGSIVPNAPPIDSGSGSGSGSAGSGSAAGSGNGNGNASQATPGVLEVDVLASRSASVGGKPYTDDDLENLFRVAHVRDKATIVVFHADKSIANGRVVELMDRAKQAGLTHLAIGSVNGANVELELPSAKSALAPSPPLVVEVSATGEVLVAGKAMPDAALDNLFRATFARDKAALVVIKPDKATPHARLVNLVERAKQAGLTRLAIGTGS